MKKLSKLKEGLTKMNGNDTDTHWTQINNTPMFSSVWLALFNKLRNNYIERRLETAADTDCSQV